ncbi:MAG: ATP-binding protein [Kiritimatiellae bacterium]|nr:ATP-binding protein [Kiritimatiellia bacterium]
MIFFQILVIITLTVNGALGALVFFINPRRPANVHFLILTIIVSAWLGCLVFGSFSMKQEIVVFWMRQAGIWAALFLPATDAMRLAITGREGYRQKAKKRIVLWLFPIIPVVLLCHTHWFIQGAVIKSGQFHEPIYGAGIFFYTFYFLITIGILLFELGKDLRTLTGVHRAELNFILLGCAIGGLSAIALTQILPALTQNWQIAKFAPLSVICIDGFVAYGIATRRIMAVTDVLRRIIAYSVLTTGLILLYTAVWKIVDGLLFLVFGHGAYLSQIIAAVTVALSMAPSLGWMHHLANRLFLSARVINVQDAIRKTTRMLQSITTLDQLLEQFCQTISAAVGAEQAVILLATEDRFSQRYPPSGDGGIILTTDDPLIKRLQVMNEPLERDVARRIHYNHNLWEACNSMVRLNMELAIGIRSKDRLAGLLLLGARQSGRIYGAREQDALQLLGNQLSVAIENARLYTELQDGKLYNEFLVDNLVSGVIAVNARQLITVFNREARRITGQAFEDTLNRPAEVLPPVLGNIIRKTLNTGIGIRDYDANLKANDIGEDIPIRLGSAIFRGPDNRILGALLVFNDQTAIKKLELQVRRSDRMASLGTLSAGMAHEIKNPLVTIKTFTQLLPERYEDPDFRKTFARLLEEEVNRIDGIVNELLTLARPSKPVLSSIHLHQVLEHALELVQQQLLQKKITLICTFDAADDSIKGDANLLGQMFINLFLNAIDAMDAVTRARDLTVRTCLVQHLLQTPNTEDTADSVPHMMVSIGDTGEGISPEDTPHIFDPFFTTKSTGTGLGLSVAHRIAKEHSAGIDVESKQGHGTVFQVIIPLDTGMKIAAAPTNNTPN